MENLFCLEQAINLSNKSKLQRSIISPVRMIYPKLLEYMHSTKQMKASTFWGGNMNIILPEIVSTHIWRYGYYENDVSHYILQYLQPGMTFIDIGAHFGLFSLLASHLVKEEGKVFSIEPTPSTFQFLTHNLNTYNDHQNYQTFNLAIYDETKKISFLDFGIEQSAFNSLYASRSNAESNQLSSPIQVQAVTLDDFVKSENITKIDLIKVDAESAEMNVVRGAKYTLQKLKPAIILEFGDFGFTNVAKSREIIDVIISLGYQPYEWSGGSIVPHQLRESYEIEQLTCYNFLFLPKKEA